MKRFWRGKQRLSPEEVRKMNEAVSPKDAYRVFSETIRKCECFQGWRKDGPKRFNETRPDLVRIIDLIYADKWSRVVGLCATLDVRIAVPSEITTAHFGINAERKGDELIYSFALVPGAGVRLSAEMEDSWRIAEGGLGKFSESLLRSVESDLLPWLEQCKDANSLLAWMDAEKLGTIRWPLMATLGKTIEIREELREMIASVPENRLLERTIDWITKTDVLTETEAKELRLANMQIEESYHQRMKALAISMSV